MKFKNVFWGILLLIIGVVFALRNFNVIHFHWRALLDLWPLLIILWGISVLPVKPVFKLTGAILVAGTALFMLYSIPASRYSGCFFDWNEGDFEYRYSDTEDWVPEDQNLIEPFDSLVTKATLNLNAVAGKYILGDTTVEMISFRSTGNVGPYVMTSFDNIEGRNIKVVLEGVKIRSGNASNEVNIRLNPHPEWSFEIDAGASDIDMDLSEFKIRRIDLEGGATSMDIKLGNRVDTVNVSLEMGAASSTIRIPRESGCELRSESVLSSRKLDGFDRIRSGLWQTPGFQEAPQKIFIRIESAVSDIRIERY